MDRKGLPSVLLVGVLWPSAAWAQRLGGGGQGADISIMRVIAALAVCLAAAVALVLIVKARRKPFAWRSTSEWLAKAMARSSRIDVVETRRVSAFADICLMRCDGVEYLLLCGASGHKVLRRSFPPDELAG